MINRLRRTIIIMNMSLVGVVIAAIFVVLCVNSYTNRVDVLSHSLNEIINRDFEGEMPRGEFRIGFSDSESQDMPGRDKDAQMKKSFEDNPMKLNSFVKVRIDKDGNILDKEESNAEIEENVLASCVEYVLDSHKPSGEILGYKLMYVEKESDGKHFIVFTDTTSIYSELNSTILISVGLFVASLIVLFVISLLLSGLAVKPVKKAWKQQKQFVADASHELKTPLTVILANNNIMMSHTDSKISDERQWLDSTEEEAQHMKKLIDQMLFLAKNDAGTAEIQLSEVNFSEIAEAAALNFEPVAFEKEVLIDTSITPDIMLHGNSMQLNQLTHILIDNAVKYSEEKSTVTVMLQRIGDQAYFSVHNTGNTISPEDLKHIFDRFFRAEKSRTSEGYGLGLSIAQHIAHNMNGRLTASSDPEQGTTFTAVFKIK